MAKTKQFYNRLEEIIKEVIDNSEISLNYDCIRDVRYKVDNACSNFYKEQTIIKSNRHLYNRDVESYIFGVFLSKYIREDNKENMIYTLTDLIYHAYLYGDNPMTSPDVSICINNKTNWNKDNRLKGVNL